MATQQWIEENQEKIKQYRREWYNRNKEHAKKKVRERKQDIAEWFKEIKNTLSCIFCGENHPATLDFHHRNPEEKDILLARVTSNGWSKERILKEIEKCDVLCANCHRKLHYSG